MATRYFIAIAIGPHSTIDYERIEAPSPEEALDKVRITAENYDLLHLYELKSKDPLLAAGPKSTRIWVKEE